MPNLLMQQARGERVDKIATLRVEMESARRAADALRAESEAIADELGVTIADRESLIGPRPDSILGRLATLRLARYRAESDKPSGEEIKLAARGEMLESALLGLRRDGMAASSAAIAKQERFEKAVSAFGRDYPSEGAQMWLAPGGNPYASRPVDDDAPIRTYIAGSDR